MLGKKKKEELTSEEYLQKAQEQMQDIKEQWSTFFKTGIIIFAALIAIIAICIAWFVSNSNVEATGAKVQAVGSEFDLAAAGTTDNKGWYDDLLEVLPGVQKQSGDKNLLSTDESHTSITWAITKESNIKNQIDRGIEPGSSGSLTFYVIPHKSGSLNVALNLALIGYNTEREGNSEITKENIEKIDSATQRLLEGHLLLFAGYNSDTNSYKGWISEDADQWTMNLAENISLSRTKDGELIWKSENAVKDVAYPVTIYWVWPETLESYLVNSDTYTGRRLLLFPKNLDSSDDNSETLPGNLFKIMCEAGANATSNRYFCWEDTGVFKSAVTENVLSQMRTNFNPVIYGTISVYYNLADQYLGENVRFVKLKLDAQ